MARRVFEEPKTTETDRPGSHSSGVHAATTRRQSREASRSKRPEGLIGTIPQAALGADFQPVVELHTGELRGYEVLARCQADGLRDPDELFARAAFERNVGEVGRAIRAIAVRECAGLPLFVSVHPSELRDALIVRPDDPIGHHDAPVFIQIAQANLSGVAGQMVRELGGRSGMGLVLDDFGAGPTTLKQLVDFAPAAIKLDRELCAGLDRSLRKQVVIRNLVSMCEQLGARVIGTSLDCEAELAAAIDCGVHYGQGYVVGEPTSVPGAPRLTP
jgi:EAL domain-containing protein (putative c-di-GMP-specific phosphodiesterase class I)